MTLRNNFFAMRIFCLVLTFSLLGACASMNEAECMNADWEQIGIEDGANGNDESSIAKHRKACASHGVTPDFEQYQTGYENGLLRYCDEFSGYLSGKRGRPYLGVCPIALEADFLYGYEKGRELFVLQTQINTMNGSLRQYRSKKEKGKNKINEIERKLIAEENTASERVSLLQDIKKLQKEQGTLEARIRHLEVQVVVQQIAYTNLEKEYR